jgi:hypothetical protein
MDVGISPVPFYIKMRYWNEKLSLFIEFIDNLYIIFDLCDKILKTRMD